jgi:hypothetical protein
MALRLLTTFASAAVLLVLTAASALAATPTDDVYAPVDHRTATATATASGASGDPSSLPFTGFELAALIVAGLIVLATGLLVRRASRSD